MTILKKIINNEIEFSLFFLFVLLFIYTIIAATLLQVIILPDYFPNWVNEFGMLKQTDSIKYHEWSVELSNKINAHGWSSWELFPAAGASKHFIVGLSAIFYSLIYPEPWAMIPANAFVHALSGVILVRIAFLFTKDWRIACIAMMPYVFYPSASMWFSQLLKDGYFNLGVILFCYGWMLVASENITTKKQNNILMSLIYILLGYLLMALIRPYAFYVMRVEVIAFSILISLFYTYKYFQNNIDHYDVIKKIMLCFICFFILKASSMFVVTVSFIDQEKMEYSQMQASTDAYNPSLFSTISADSTNELKWVSTGWIPKSIDSKLATLSGMRTAFIYNYYVYGRGHSSIDIDALFNSAIDVFAYIPRATQIAFLSPFPDIWFGKGSTDSTTVMRKITMFEMLIIYFILIFLPFALWKWKMKTELWVAFIYCYSMMLMFSISIPNVGTLYRYRYGFFMIIITIVLVYALEFLQNFAKNNNFKRETIS